MHCADHDRTTHQVGDRIIAGVVDQVACCALVGRSRQDRCMDLLRTPEDRFLGLPDWPHPPSYVTVDGVRIAYYDTGNPEASAVLLLHGEPTWSYLYRNVIPPLITAEHRVIAIDLVGFGRSDKPASRGAYTYQRHVEWLKSVVFDHLDLTDITHYVLPRLGRSARIAVGCRLPRAIRPRYRGQYVSGKS